MEMKKEEILEEIKLLIKKRWFEIEEGTARGATSAVTKMNKLIQDTEDKETLAYILKSLLESTNPKEVMTGCAYAFSEGLLRDIAWVKLKQVILSGEANPSYMDAHLLVMMYATEEEREELRDYGYL